MRYIIANWKEKGSKEHAASWIRTIAENQELIKSEYTYIVCPPFTLLSIVHHELNIHKLPIFVGSQTISQYEAGNYTGEVSAAMIREFATYTIIGHSERRQLFFETDEIVNKKIQMAEKIGVTPIVCISNIEEAESIARAIPNYQHIVVYEPLFAIGTGKAETPENANKMAESIRKHLPKASVLYGGSVDKDNTAAFMSQPQLSGIISGTRSADSAFFLEIIKHAA